MLILFTTLRQNDTADTVIIYSILGHYKTTIGLHYTLYYKFATLAPNIGKFVRKYLMKAINRKCLHKRINSPYKYHGSVLIAN